MSHSALYPTARDRQATRQLIGWLLAALAFSFLALVTRLNEVTHDAFHEMALFREFVVTGVFPQVDLFAYTPTVNPSVHHEWGTGAVLYFVTTTTGLGLTGLTILRFALMGTLWSMLYRVARLRGVHPMLFAMLAITVYPMLWVGFATIRATLFTLVFLSIQLWMHEVDRRGGRYWLVAWWCMLVVWLNMHAGFIVGVGLLGLHAGQRFLTHWYQSGSWRLAWRATWHLALVLPMVGLAVMVNPYGSQYVPYLIKAIGMPRPLIAEWWPLWYTHDPLITLGLFAISTVLVLLSIRRQPLGSLLGLVGLCVCAILAIKHLRHGSIYAVVWIAYGPAWLTHTSLGREIVRFINSRRQLALPIAQAIVVACLGWAVSFECWQTTVSGQTTRQSTCYPLGAIQYLREHQFRGNLLTPFHAGAFVSWELYPDVKVSLDGRYEVAYQPPVFDEHWEFFEAHSNWQRLLDNYPHDAILVDQTAKVRPLLEQFRNSTADWQFVYEDPSYIVLARRGSSLPPVVRQAPGDLAQR
ncbi:MAG: hypothetical protein IT423_06690 [Pirellulaceae bacterium]|nr:hypothetical protein [Pirellulaceae bacterium]